MRFYIPISGFFFSLSPWKWDVSDASTEVNIFDIKKEALDM